MVPTKAGCCRARRERVTTLLLVIAFGSAYAALSIRSAKARVQTEKENLNQANIKIQSTADDAKRQRQLALESLNSLVTKVQDFKR